MWAAYYYQAMKSQWLKILAPGVTFLANYIIMLTTKYKPPNISCFESLILTTSVTQTLNFLHFENLKLNKAFGLTK